MSKRDWTIVALFLIIIMVVIWASLISEIYYTSEKVNECGKLCSGMDAMANETGCYCHFHEWVKVR